MELTPTVSSVSHVSLDPTPIVTAVPPTCSISPIKATWRLYANIFVAALQPFQFGWSTSQMNNAIFNNEDECNAIPIAPGTCLMFPGHTKAQWTLAVSSWILGGMIGSLVTGRISNKFGRKPSMMINCLFMMAGAAIQAGSSNISIFTLGRVFAGIATGGSTAVTPGFIGEICPPHLRSKLSVCFQISITLGHLSVAIAFFFASTSTGWRYIAAFPIVLAFLFFVLAPFVLVESPAWLSMVGRPQIAERELAHLFGQENLFLAKTWIEHKKVAPCMRVGSECGIPMQDLRVSMALMARTVPKSRGILDLISPSLRRQFLVAIGVASAQQLTGINAVFFYSSGLFKQAGLSDSRVGVLAVNFVNVLPTLFSGMLSAQLGNRNLILIGFLGMFCSAAGMTAALVGSLPALAIVFTALYVMTFGSSMGPLAWGIMADLFPDDVRAIGCSLCIGCSWLCNLAVGLAYPYIANTFKDYSFVPFMCTATLAFLFFHTFVPETYGKTIQEIQDEFELRRLKKLHDREQWRSSSKSQIALLDFVSREYLSRTTISTLLIVKRVWVDTLRECVTRQIIVL
ncbi:putative major facilitator, sugar transporter, major facilitator superfamily [Plasmopara halstedii]